MTSILRGQLGNMDQHHRFNLNHPNWLGILALLGFLLLGTGVLLAQAANSDEKVLPSILAQLSEQGLKVKSSSVMDRGGRSTITIVLENKETRLYDERGRLVEVKDGKGKRTIYRDGMPVEERDGRGGLLSTTQYLRSPEGQVRKLVRKGVAGTLTKVFDGKGNIIQSTDSHGTKTYSNYVKDNRGRTVSYFETDMSTNKTSKYFLDPKTGEIKSKTDENGNQVDIEQTKDQNNEVVASQERDQHGNLTIRKFRQGQLVEELRNDTRTTYENVVDDKGALQRSIEKRYLNTEKGQMVEVVEKKFDSTGRVTQMIDRMGEHTYRYDQDEDGRVVTRYEGLTPRDPGLKQPGERVTRYDKSGHVIGLEEPGKTTQSSYVFDSKGNILTSIDRVTYRFGGSAFTDVEHKTYDERGNMITKTDGRGFHYEFAYDDRGNRLTVKGPDEFTRNHYDHFDNLVGSVTRNHKSLTYTRIDPQTHMAEERVKVSNSGVVEPTNFEMDKEGKRISITLKPFGVLVTQYLSPYSDQPLHTWYFKYNGKVITTDYTYIDEHLMSSVENGPTGRTETQFDVWGKPSESSRVDQWGRHYGTSYEYSEGMMSRSLMQDEKGRSETEYNIYEEPTRITRINTIGFPRKSIEERTYTNGMLTETVVTDVKGKSITGFDANEQATTVHRVNRHGFPRENWVANIYDAGGDIVRSLQTDRRGSTQNTFDTDGLMSKSIRSDLHGFPRVKTTDYEYVKGELLISRGFDDRGRTVNQFDKDALMRTSIRTKLFGFPRLETTQYDYDADGYMTYSSENDENGSTESHYTIDEVVGYSVRENLYGHARRQLTQFDYDDDGYMSWSRESDLRGVTVTRYDIDSLARESTRFDQYGVYFGRETVTTSEYDENGFLTESMAKNLMSTTVRRFDKDGLARWIQQDDLFGLVLGREKISTDFKYDEHGRLQSNITDDQMGTTTSQYDIQGDAIKTHRVAKGYGLESTWESDTESAFDDATGMTTYRISVTKYGRTESLDFDPVFGFETRQISDNNYGLESVRHTESQVEMDRRHGLNHRTVAVNGYGTTETLYDTVHDGPYGVAVSSHSVNNYGLGFARDTQTEITADVNSGLNRKTVAVNQYGTTTTFFDTLDGKRSGTALRSESQNQFGLGASRQTATDIESNLMNGLNRRTTASNAYGTTVTEYEDQITGVALRSDATNQFGLGFTQKNHTEIQANSYNGLNESTVSANDYGTTTTWYDSERTGVALESKSNNRFGLNLTRNTATVITADTNTGLNRLTVGTSEYGTTETTYDTAQDGTYGVAVSSVVNNNYGLGASKLTTNQIQANTFNGLTEKNTAVNDYGITETTYDASEGRNVGVPIASHAINFYGIGASRLTDTQIRANADNGLNIETLAMNEYGVTRTLYDQDQFGLALESFAQTNFGLGASRSTHTWITGNADNGLNQQTVAVNDYGTTTTWYDDQRTGVAQRSLAVNNFGVDAARTTNTAITASLYNGLNQYTRASNDYGTTETWFANDTYGTAEISQSLNKFGLVFSQATRTEITADSWSGLNRKTFATNSYGTTETWYKDDTYGIPDRSHAVNNFGLDSSRDSATQIIANEQNGLNVNTKATNAYGFTETWYSNDTYGLPERSAALNNFGLRLTRETHTQIEGNHYNGLNVRTEAENAYGRTTTHYDSDQYGVARDSTAENRFGLGATQVTNTQINANIQDGLNTSTVAVNSYGTTTTLYDDTDTGLAVSSRAVNNFGLKDTQTTDTTIRGNRWTGLNQSTHAVNLYGTTDTLFEDKDTGVSLSSRAVNNFGLGATLTTDTQITANKDNGLNIRTEATNAYSITQTEYDQDRTGVAERSDSTTQFGLLSARVTHTEITADTYTGLNIETFATNNYGETRTSYDHKTSGVATSSIADNHFGLEFSRRTETAIIANLENGLNQQTTAVNVYGTTITDYDNQNDHATGVAVHSLSRNNFGVNGARETDTQIQANTYNGLNISTLAVNGLGKTLTNYESEHYGIATDSEAWNNFGLNHTRHSQTAISANATTGLNIQTVSDTDYGHTVTTFDDQEHGVALRSETNNYFGLLSTRDTSTQITANINTGLNTQTVGESAYGQTTTRYDDGNTGANVWSQSVNRFGLEASRITTTWDFQVDTWTGQNQKTTADNRYGRTTTDYDHADSGVAVHSTSWNNFGLGDSRVTNTTITANHDNGLNQVTTAGNLYGSTVTYYDDQKYGVALNSDSDNNFGLGAAKLTHTIITSDTWNGLNQLTEAHNQYGDTTTFYESSEYGLPQRSLAHNHFGLTTTLEVETLITANSDNGLNEKTVAMTGYSTTTTYFDKDDYGVALTSDSENLYGLLYTRSTHTAITADTDTGQNIETIASNDYGTTTTRYDHTRTGVAQSSHAVNRFGLGFTKETDTTITADTYNGLNIQTLAQNDYGDTTTDYYHNAGSHDQRDTSGVAYRSLAVNKFGLGATLTTHTTIAANIATGLNLSTEALNDYGRTLTLYDDQSTGVAKSSESWNNFGLVLTRHNNTSITANTNNGLNQSTYAINEYGETLTTFDDQSTGVAQASNSTNKYGLGATLTTATKIHANTDNGLNRSTEAENAYGRTVTLYDQQKTGVATSSESWNLYGLGKTRHTWTSITANVINGLNTTTVGTNGYGQTTTQYDDAQYGVAVHSTAVNNYGLGGAHTTETDIRANVKNGLNQGTTALNGLGSTVTEYDDQTTGVALRSDATNLFGLGATLQTHTQIEADTFNGLNITTTSDNAYGSTYTEYDHQSTGVAQYSKASNKYGLLNSRITETRITADTENGLNHGTVATNNYGRTETLYDDQLTGVATSSVATNLYGLKSTLVTNTQITANLFNGLNIQTEATNAYGSTLTEYDDQHSGVALRSTSDNHFGLGFTRHTATDIQANTFNGLNQKTTALNAYGQTVTTFDDQEYGVALGSVADNNFGLKATLHTVTVINANPENGLNRETSSTSDYGQTITRYDAQQYGVALSSISTNNYGLLSVKVTNTTIDTNLHTGLNRQTVATNSYGKTTTDFDDQTYGVAILIVSVNKYGLTDTRNTTTDHIQVNTNNGLNRETTASNRYGRTVTTYDDQQYGVAVSSVSDNQYGLLSTLHTVTQITANTTNGLNQRTSAVNDYGTTTTNYDDQQFGIAISSASDNRYGLHLTRHTETDLSHNGNAVDIFTGLNIRSTAVNTYGSTDTDYDHTDSGVAVHSVSHNNFGLTSTRLTDTMIAANHANGLNISTVAHSDYGDTTTWYDYGGTGVALRNWSDNNFGIGMTRHTGTSFDVNLTTGLNRSSTANNTYGTTVTQYDDTDTGVALESDSTNHVGLTFSRQTHTLITSNRDNGLNERTLAVNAYGITETHYDSVAYGVATNSTANNFYGLHSGRHTDTQISASIRTGLNLQTVSTNDYGTTTTEYFTDGENAGLAKRSIADNQWGLTSTRHAVTDIQANGENGLNHMTLATTAYGTTQTFYDDGTAPAAINTQFGRLNLIKAGVNLTGSALYSIAHNNYGLGAAKDSVTIVNANEGTGLNRETAAYSRYGVTTTQYDQNDSGVALSSLSVNNIGLVDTRRTNTQIQANQYTGMNESTVAVNTYGETTTWYEYPFGTATHTTSRNNVGLLETRLTENEITSNHANGLNRQTVATSSYGTTTTWYDDAESGVALRSTADNHYGLDSTRHQETAIVANRDTGLNQMTIAHTFYGFTTTYFDDGSAHAAKYSDPLLGLVDYGRPSVATTGCAILTVSDNSYGLGATRHSVTTVNANIRNGLNKTTVAHSQYGTTTNYYDDGELGTTVSDPVLGRVFNLTMAPKTGAALYSISENNYGFGWGRHTLTLNQVNPGNGMNRVSRAISRSGETFTYYDSTDSGIATSSVSNSSIGLLSTRRTTSRIWASRFNGLNERTEATNNYGVTTTEYLQDGTGRGYRSVSDNRWGMFMTRHSETLLDASAMTGLNHYSMAVASDGNGNIYGTTQTWFDDGVNGYSVNDPVLGMTINLNPSKPSLRNTGATLYSISDNNFGLRSTRHSLTQATVNGENGLNHTTTAFSRYGRTTTYYDDGVNNASSFRDTTLGVTFALTPPATRLTGSVLYSQTDNNYGVAFARHSFTSTEVNLETGLNRRTMAQTGLGYTLTNYEDQGTGLATTSDSYNYYGTLQNRHSHNTVMINRNTGMNIHNQATTDSSVVDTYYDEVKGTAFYSTSRSQQGLLSTRYTSTNIWQDEDSGLNTTTLATTDYGTTQTWYHATLGTATTAVSNNRFGLLMGRYSITTYDVNTNTGQNLTSTSYSIYGNQTYSSSTTTYDQTFGTAASAVSTSYYGAIGSRSTTTTYQTDHNTGLNRSSSAVNQLGRTVTNYIDENTGQPNPFGVAVKTYSYSNLGAGGGRSTTTTAHVDRYTGLNLSTEAENLLTKTITTYDNENYGIARRSESFAKNGALKTRHSVTWIESNLVTGLNLATHSVSEMSDSYTFYDLNGFQTSGQTRMNADYNWAGSVLNNYTYVVNTNTGQLDHAYSENELSGTLTVYDNQGKGLMTDSYTLNEFGVAKYSHTHVSSRDHITGVNRETLTTSYGNYSAFQSGNWVSKTTSYNNDDGITLRSMAENRTGATKGRWTHTDYTNDPGTGNKIWSHSKSAGSGANAAAGSGLFSESWTNYNQKGLDVYTQTLNHLGGPSLAAWTYTRTLAWDKNSGTKRMTYAKNGLNATMTYYDRNGGPQITYTTGDYNSGVKYQERLSEYGDAEGNRLESIYCLGYYASGTPSMTIGVTAISLRENYYDEGYTTKGHGFITRTVTHNSYATRGNETSTTKYTVNDATGVYTYSKTTGSNGKTSESWYNADGSVNRSYREKTTTYYGSRSDTGMTNKLDAYGENSYHKAGEVFDSNGRCMQAYVFYVADDGKDKKNVQYRVTYHYNNWTGTMIEENRSAIENFESKTIYYDQDGGESSSWSRNTGPTGTVATHVTYQNYVDGTPGVAIHNSYFNYNNYQDITMYNLMPTTTATGDQEYHPRDVIVTLNNIWTGVSQISIHYDLGINRQPISAVATDALGVEVWETTGYDQVSILRRTRANNDGSTFTWDYTADNPGDGSQYHASANIAYTNLWGYFNGSGTETYTAMGVVIQRVLHNTDELDETINYQNDGLYVTRAIGQREDGVTTYYDYVGNNMLATSSDDKGITTWNTANIANHKRLSTQNNMGTFYYQYSPDGSISKITGAVSIAGVNKGNVEFDEHWNLTKWTDTLGQVHTYRAAQSYKSHWSKAIETFTDSYGGEWTGEVSYAQFGFYFQGENLRGTNVRLDQVAAVNTVQLDDQSVFSYISNQLDTLDLEQETYTWAAPGEQAGGQRTLAEVEKTQFTTAYLQRLGDVELRIAANGTTEAFFKNIHYQIPQVVKQIRYKPVSTSRTYTVTSDTPPEEVNTINNGIKDDPFASGEVGKVVRRVSSRQVPNGTRSEIVNGQVVEIPVTTTEWTLTEDTWTKAEDGWQWALTGNRTDRVLTETMSLASTVQVTAAPTTTVRPGTVAVGAGVDIARILSGRPRALGGYLGSFVAAVQPPATVEPIDAKTPTADQPAETGQAIAAGAVVLGGSSKTKTAAKTLTQAQKDALMDKIRSAKSLADLAEFVQLARQLLGQDSVVQALDRSNAGAVWQQFKGAYAAVFGEAYQNSAYASALSSIFDMAAVIDEVRLSLPGPEAAPKEVKVQVAIAQELEKTKDAKRDQEGRVIEGKDSRGVVHKLTYESSGLTDALRNPDGTVAIRHYDYDGRLLSENQGGKSRTYAYEVSSLGQLRKVRVQERSSDGPASLEYDSEGRLLVAERNGQTTTYTYDPKNTKLVTAKSFNADGSSLEEKQYKEGRLSQLKRSDGTVVKYEYLTDENGKVLAATQTITDKDKQTTILKYDGAGRLISALGKDANQFEKMAQDGTLEKTFAFELDKQLFSDPRMDSMRLDQKKLFQGAQPGNH